MRPYQAVIFDMDGVLADSEPLHHRASQFALGDRGASFTARDHLALLGSTDEDLLRVLRILYDLPRTTADLVAAKQRHLVHLIALEATPLPGVPEVVLALRARGLGLALTSLSARPIIGAMLARLGLQDIFRAVVSGDEVARGKPAPDGFLMAARRLGVEPGRCLVVEDSPDGVLAAKAAGMAVAAIPSPMAYDRGQSDFSMADLVLPSLETLPKAMELIL